MLGTFVVLLLDEGPTLQQHMESEILQLFNNKKEMPARLWHLGIAPLSQILRENGGLRGL